MRRATAAIAAGLALAAATVVAAPQAVAKATPASSPWSQTDGTAGRARANLTETTLSTSTVKHVIRLRNLASPEPTNNCDGGVPRSPVLAGGVVYDMASGWVNAYDAADGLLLWQQDFDPADDPSSETLLTTLVVADGKVLVGGDYCDSSSDPNGFVFALDAVTGDQVWRSSGSYGALDYFVVSGNEVVATGASLGSGAVITAYDLSSGTADWIQSGDSSCDPSPAIVVRDVVVTPLCPFPDSVPELAGFDLMTGAPLWQHDGLWSVYAGSDHSTHGHVYVRPDGGAITDINAATGATRFTLTDATQVLAVDDSSVYAGCGSGTVCAYDEATGTKVWQVADVSTLAAEANGVLYLADGKALRASSGKLLKRLWKPTAASLAVGDGRIAVDKPVDDTSATMQLYGLPGE